MGLLQKHLKAITGIQEDKNKLLAYYKTLERWEKAGGLFPMALAAGNSYRQVMETVMKKRCETPLDLQEGLSITFSPEGVVAETVFGFSIVLTCRDDSSLISDGYLVNETSETLLMLKAAEFASTFVDVGANVGYYSLLFAASADDPFRAFAFEPVSDVYERMAESVRRNGFEDRIKPFRNAVGSRYARMKIKIHRHGSGGSSLSDQFSSAADYSGHEENVQQVSLDRFFEEQGIADGFTVLKVDTEGSEREVLNGADNILRSDNPPVVMIETFRGPRDNDSAVLNHLRQLGYDIFGIRKFRPGRQVLRPAFRLGCLRRMKSGNYIAFHRNHRELKMWCLEPESDEFLISRHRIERIRGFQQRSVQAATRYREQIESMAATVPDLKTGRIPPWHDFHAPPDKQ